MMGYLSACEMRQYLSEEQALTWHLQHNHYPPISLIYLPAAREALGQARIGDLNSKVHLPSGEYADVLEIVKWFHLDAFLATDSMEEAND